MTDSGKASHTTRNSIAAIVSAGAIIVAVIYLGTLPQTTRVVQRTDTHPAEPNAITPAISTTPASTAPAQVETDTNLRLLTQAELDAGRQYASVSMEVFDSQEALESWVASLQDDPSFTFAPIVIHDEHGHIRILEIQSPIAVVDKEKTPAFERWPMMVAERGERWSPEVIGAPGRPECWPLPDEAFEQLR